MQTHKKATEIKFISLTPQVIAIAAITLVLYNVTGKLIFVALCILTAVGLKAYEEIRYRRLDPGLLIYDCAPKSYLLFLQRMDKTHLLPMTKAIATTKKLNAYLDLGELDQAKICLDMLEGAHLTRKAQAYYTVLAAGYYAAVENEAKYQKLLPLVKEYSGRKKNHNSDLLLLYEALRTRQYEKFIQIKECTEAQKDLSPKNRVILHFLCCRYYREIGNDEAYQASYAFVAQFNNQLKYQALL